MSFNQIASEITTINNLFASINASVVPELPSNAIADLIRKRRHRIEHEKMVKNAGKSVEVLLSELLGASSSADDENETPFKKSKVEDQTLEPVVILNNPSTSTGIESSLLSAFSPLLLSDSLPFSLLSSLPSPWSQTFSSSSSSSSSNSSSSSPPPSLALSAAPTKSNFDASQKEIGDEFTTVAGRLSLLNSQKYVVTVGEMTRRIFGPESFSFSLLGGLLRRAKTPNNTNALKAELESIGIELERGRRRTCRYTLFCGLLEGEAVQLGKDFKHLLTEIFPFQFIAYHLAEANAAAEKEKRIKKINELQIVKNHVMEFLNILNEDASPVMDSYPLETLPEYLQSQLTDFSLLTHGFGIYAVKSVMEMYRQSLDVQISALT